LGRSRFERAISAGHYLNQFKWSSGHMNGWFPISSAQREGAPGSTLCWQSRVSKGFDTRRNFYGARLNVWKAIVISTMHVETFGHASKSLLAVSKRFSTPNNLYGQCLNVLKAVVMATVHGKLLGRASKFLRSASKRLDAMRNGYGTFPNAWKPIVIPRPG
jgi:hypothetical protein